jgi:hypothetical protein
MMVEFNTASRIETEGESQHQWRDREREVEERSNIPAIFSLQVNSTEKKTFLGTYCSSFK